MRNVITYYLREKINIKYLPQIFFELKKEPIKIWIIHYMDDVYSSV